MHDLIDRQAAIDFIDAGHLVNPNEPRWSDNEIVNFLKSRPSALPERCEDCENFNKTRLLIPQPERKTGRWIYGEHDVAMCDGYWCDKCGFFVPWDYQHKSIDFIKDYHLCPSCGADMREPEDIPMEYFESGGR